MKTGTNKTGRVLVFLTLIYATLNAPTALSQTRVMSDEHLLYQYGETLRESYRTGDTSIAQSEYFLSLEAEAVQRNLIDRGRMRDIERGILYVGMPLGQALASIAPLTEVDSLSINATVVRAFRGGRPGFGLSFPARRTDTIIACNDRVVAIFATGGLVTAETYSGGRYGAREIHFQTNFRPDFWHRDNREARRRGRTVFDSPSSFADRWGHHWSLFSDNSGNFTKPSVWWNTGRGHVSNRGLSGTLHQTMRRTLEDGNDPSCQPY